MVKQIGGRRAESQNPHLASRLRATLAPSAQYLRYMLIPHILVPQRKFTTSEYCYYNASPLDAAPSARRFPEVTWAVSARNRALHISVATATVSNRWPIIANSQTAPRINAKKMRFLRRSSSRTRHILFRMSDR